MTDEKRDWQGAEPTQVPTTPGQPPGQDSGPSPATVAGPPAAAQTVVSDLSGGSVEPTRVTGPGPGVTAVTGLPTRPPAQAPTAVTRAAGPQQTQVTSLNVDAGRPRAGDAAGTHHGQVWGDFALGELLGKGGMGAVYKGRQLSLDRPVAIKVLPPHLSANENFLARFSIEAKAVAQISSPHVVQVYAAGQHEGHHFFAMEFVEGEDLSRRLRDGWKPPHAEALDCVTQAARGLAAAGEHGIIHRDIKPANMMMTKRGVLKLMDFGLAKLAAAGGDTGLTMAGTIMGTVNYFSPEQGRGEVCDQRTDIYALGVVFYELLTGRLPFVGQDATSIIYQHIHQAPRAPKEIDPSIPEDFQAVVLKCLQKKADDRYPDAGALLRDLEALARGLAPGGALADPHGTRTGGTVVRSGPFGRERRGPSALAIGGALVAVAAGVTAVVLLRRPAPPAAVPVAPVASVPATGSAPAAAATAVDTQEKLLVEVRDLLKAGAFEAARRQAEDQARQHGDDARWTALLADVERAHGEALIREAQAALEAGDTERAGRAAATAQGLLPDDAALRAVLGRIAEREGGAKQRARVLDEARAALREGRPEKAEEMLGALARELPADEEVAKELRLASRARAERDDRQKALRDQLEAGDKALERKDLDAAQLAFTAALQHDPSSQRATAGLTSVNRLKDEVAKVRERFSGALRGRDLATATTALDELRALVPNSATVVLAEAELANSKLAEEEQKRRLAETEARMSAQARTVLQVIEDPKADIPAMERALAGFLANAGADRPERADLERRIEDKRQLARVGAALEGLDRAVLAGDAAAVRAVVQDTGFADALLALSRYEGLVFASHATGFERDGAQAVLQVSIRHALKVYPERTLRYVWRLRQEAGGWVIVAAELQP